MTIDNGEASVKKENTERKTDAVDYLSGIFDLVPDRAPQRDIASSWQEVEIDEFDLTDMYGRRK